MKLDIKIPNNPIKNWGTDLNREFSIKESQMAKDIKGITLHP